MFVIGTQKDITNLEKVKMDITHIVLNYTKDSAGYMFSKKIRHKEKELPVLTRGKLHYTTFVFLQIFIRQY